jgi:protease I
MNLLAGKKIILVVASVGYQPVEYETTKKIVMQAGVKVLTASDKPGGAVASDKSTTIVDLTLDDLKDTVQNYDGIFFIGGPGALNCLDHSLSYHIIAQAKKHNIPYGAICISPRILAKADALRGKKATGWDDDNALTTIFAGFGVIYEKNKDIVTDGLIVTARGPRNAEQFAQGILRVLTKKELKEEDQIPD